MSTRKDPQHVQQGARLRAAREAAHFGSAARAATAFGWTESAYRHHENGTRPMTPGTAEKYAKAFRAKGVKVTGQTILYGEIPILERASPATTTQVMSVLDFASAARLADPNAQIPVEGRQPVAIPGLGRGGDYFALRVEGDSMDLIAGDGWTIVVDRSRRVLIPGRNYVFCWRGECTFKQWQTDPERLEPLSSNREHRPIYVRSKGGLDVIGEVVAAFHVFKKI